MMRVSILLTIMPLYLLVSRTYMIMLSLLTICSHNAYQINHEYSMKTGTLAAIGKPTQSNYMI